MRAIDVAVDAKRPVYLEVPRDMVTAGIAVPPDGARAEAGGDEGVSMGQHRHHGTPLDRVIARLVAAKNRVRGS